MVYFIVSSDSYIDNGIPILTANKAFTLGYTNDKDGIYKKVECIIFDDFTMDSKFVNFEFKVKSSAIKILTATNGNDIYFLYEYLKYLNLSSNEHKRHFISEVAHMCISVPQLEKQNQISTLLRYITSKFEITNN